MIAKVVGMCDGYHTERTWDEIEDYIFVNSCDKLEELIFTGYPNTPYSRVELLFRNGESFTFSFSDRVYMMSDEGKTIDLLKYDDKKESRYS